MKKKNWRLRRRTVFSREHLLVADPAPLSFKTRGGGGGLGRVAYKDRARPPPCGPPQVNVLLHGSRCTQVHSANWVSKDENWTFFFKCHSRSARLGFLHNRDWSRTFTAHEMQASCCDGIGVDLFC